MEDPKIVASVSVGHAQNATIIGNQFNLGLSASTIAEEIKKAFAAQDADSRRSPNANPRVLMAPPLPVQFVPRNELFKGIRERLLEPLEPHAIRVEVLHGLGGIGKSTIAKALCHSADVGEHFTDILWADFGLEPQPLQCMAQIAIAMGDSKFQLNSIREASEHLRVRLLGRRPLIVLDNVWESRDVEHFAVVPGSVILITTRRLAVSDAIGGHVTTVRPMDDAESLCLLERWIGRDLTPSEHLPATELVNAIDHLPLAVQLCGALLSRGLSWDAVRSAFEIERNRILKANMRVSPQLARVLACIRISTYDLQRRDRASWARFIRLGVLAPGTRINAAVTSTLWNTFERDAELTLHILEDDALLLSDSNAYRLHDFVYEVAVSLIQEPDPDGLGLEFESSQKEFLTSCGWSFVLGSKSPIKKDGYSLRHLTWHLEMAGEVGAIHMLLAEEGEDGRSAWFKSLSKLSELRTYSADLMRASRLATQSADAFSLQLRYALINSSLTTHAQALTSEIMQALVRRGFWDLSEAFIIAQHIIDPDHKAAILAGLCEISSSSPSLDLRESIYAAALEEVARLKPNATRAFLVARLCRYASEILRQSLLELFLDSLESGSAPWTFSSVPEHFIESLPHELHQAAIEKSLATHPGAAKVALKLASHVRYLSAALRPIWASALFSWSKAELESAEPNVLAVKQQEAQREAAIAKDEPHKVPANRTDSNFLQRLFKQNRVAMVADDSTAAKYPSDPSGTKALILVQKEDEESSQQITSRSRQSNDERSGSSLASSGSEREDLETVLMLLLREGQLTPDRLRGLIETARFIKEVNGFASATEHQRAEALLNEIDKIKDPHQKLKMLLAAKDRVAGSLQRRAKEIGSDAARECWRERSTYVDSRLMFGLRELRDLFTQSEWLELARSLIEIAKGNAFDDAGQRYATALALLDTIPDPELRSAMKLCEESSASRDAKNYVISILIGLVKAEEVGDLVSLYQSIGDDDEIMQVRLAIAPYLGPTAILDEVATLTRTHRIKTLAKMMRGLIEVLDEGQLRSFTEAASNLVSDWWIVESLGDVLLTTTDPKTIMRILTVAQDLGPADLRSKLKSKGTNRLVELGCLWEATNTSHSIDIVQERWRTLADLAERLSSGGNIEDATRLAYLIDDVEEASRARSLICLNMARFGDVNGAFRQVENIQSGRWRRWASHRLEPVRAAQPDTPVPSTSPFVAHHVAKEVTFETWFDSLDRETTEQPSIVALSDFLRNSSGAVDLSEFWKAADLQGRVLFFSHFETLVRSRCLRLIRAVLPIIGRFGTRENFSDIDRLVTTMGRWWP